MKCRNINKTNNSAIFFGSININWPKKIVFDIWCNDNANHTTNVVNIDYLNQEDTYSLHLNGFIIDDNMSSTNDIDIVILGNKRNDEYDWSKDITNLLYISEISSQDADIDRVLLKFIDNKNNTYFTTEMTISEGIANELEITVPSYATKQQNYVKDAEAISTALTQKLSIFKNELWFATKYGLPLFDKSSKGIFDAYIAMITSKQTGVKEILTFNSKVNKFEYMIDMTINSIYGKSNIQINR